MTQALEPELPGLCSKGQGDSDETAERVTGKESIVWDWELVWFGRGRVTEMREDLLGWSKTSSGQKRRL